jgi:hypothetical protein
MTINAAAQPHTIKITLKNFLMEVFPTHKSY